MANEAIKNYAREKGVRLWQVAEAVGYEDFVFSRKLRHEFPEDMTKKCIQAIDAISEGNK